MALPEKEFSGSVREMDDGVFRVATHRAGGETGVMVWFSSYRPQDRERVEALRNDAQTAIDRLFATTCLTPVRGPRFGVQGVVHGSRFKVGSRFSCGSRCWANLEPNLEPRTLNHTLNLEPCTLNRASRLSTCRSA